MLKQFDKIAEDIEHNNALITTEGAIRLIVSLRQLERGLHPISVMKALAHNLGMKRFHDEGEKITFNPLQHEDTVGGLIRGDPCEVVQCGWKLGNNLIARAKVKPLNTPTDVGTG